MFTFILSIRMTTIQIKYNKERTERIFSKYFKYERNKLFKEMPFFFMVAIGLAFFVIGFITQIGFLIYMSYATIIFMVVALVFYFLKFKKALNDFLKAIEQSAAETEGEFTFGFNEEIILYQSKKFKNEVKWETIESFEENGTDLYLFTKKRTLFDIVSKEVIGEEAYAKLKSFLGLEE